MRLAIRDLWLILCKELTCCCRDQDVFIYGIVFPFVLYPLVALLLCEGAMWSAGVWEKSRDSICVVGRDANARFIADALREDKHFILVPDKNAAADLQAGTIKALISVDGPDEVTIKTHEPSVELLTLIETVKWDIKSARKKTVETELKQKNVPDSALIPFTVDWQSVKPTVKGEGGGRSLGLRYLLDLLLQTSMLYIITVLVLVSQVASICLLVEEKEKKTLCTTLLLPVSRTKIIVAKFLAVNVAMIGSLALHVFNVLLNIGVVVAASLVYFLQRNADSHLTRVLLGQATLTQSELLFVLVSAARCVASLKTEIQLPSVADVAFVIFVLVASGAVISSCFLFAAAFAKSNKDAQTLTLIPALTFITLSAISFIPGIELNFGTALLPVCNLMIMRKFEHPPFEPACIAFLVSFALIALSLWGARVVLFSEMTPKRKFNPQARREG